MELGSGKRAKKHRSGVVTRIYHLQVVEKLEAENALLREQIQQIADAADDVMKCLKMKRLIFGDEESMEVLRKALKKES